MRVSHKAAWLAILFLHLAAMVASAYPVIEKDPASRSVATGGTATFAVQVSQVSGSRPPLTVQWRRNGQNISGAITNFTDGAGVARLVITNAQPQDAGSFYAVVFDADGAINSKLVSLLISDLQPLTFTNTYTSRFLLDKTPNGSGAGNNVNATKEPGEPDIGGKKGGSSVWMSWRADTSGIARFSTSGSDFDTTLGVYVRANAKFPYSVTNLTAVVGDDDAGGYFNSSVAFNVTAGTIYDIAIDGFYGDEGNIVLNWSLTSGTGQVPIITSQPQSLTVAKNASAVFSVNSIQNARYQWYLNNVPLAQKTNSFLAIPSATAADVGEYRVVVYFLDPIQITLSEPAHLQINFEGNVSSAAQAKFREATDTSIAPQVIHPHAVPVSGFTGTHIYSTFGAESEPGEPNHCDKAGGAPYWFAYQAPADGNLTVDADTPTFTNVLAVYTWPGGDFSTLVKIACASTNNGVGHEVTVFPTVNGTTYYLVVDGLNGAVGNVTLNYNLAQPVAITAHPQSRTVSPGSNVTLTVTATGAAPLAYQWRTNTVKFSGQTNASLTVTNFQAARQGNYDVVVNNAFNAVTSSVAALYLNSPARFGSPVFNPTGGFTATLLGMANTNYLIQVSTNLGSTNWLTLATNQSPVGIISITDTNKSPGRFYRAVPK